MSAKLDRMIAAGRFTVPQMMKATGATEDNVKQRRKRRNRLLRRGDKGGQIVVPPTSISIEGAGPDVPECPSDVPLTPAGVRAELKRMLDRQKAMEKTLKDDGPQAMPALLTIMAQQRSTIETMLKAEVVFAHMPNAGDQETPEQRAAETRAYFRRIMECLTPAAQEELLRAMTEPAPAPGQEPRHCEKETPTFSGQTSENNGDCRVPEVS
jgi:hypothetical protein